MWKLPGGVLRPSHTYFKANSRVLFSYLGLLMSLGLDQYILLENSEKKIFVGPAL